MFPSLFLSHGAPNTILKKVNTISNLRKLGDNLEKPKYIVMVSAHWCTRGLKIISPLANDLMYDFMGFEPEMYKIKYPIKSDINYTNKLLELLKDFDVTTDTYREKYDHGVWTVLMMMYEKLDIPVIQISLPLNYNIKQLMAVGQRLNSIRDEALIIGSGSLTHNLNTVSFDPYSEPSSVVQEFEDEITKVLKTGNINQILDFTSIENFSYMHPSHEHFLPIYVVIGSSENKIATTVNNEILNKTLSMQGYIFKG